MTKSFDREYSIFYFELICKEKNQQKISFMMAYATKMT